MKELQDEIRAKLDQGYATMKIKVGGAPVPQDVKRIEAALQVVKSADHLAVDANAAFDRARALAYAKALAPYALPWFEEPCDPLDYALLADVARDYAAPLATVGGFGLGGCEAYPGVFGPFAGFADDAKVENGTIRLPDRPGIGFEAQNALYAVMRELVD